MFYRFLLHFGLQLGGPRGSNEPPFGQLFWLLRPTWANLANLGQLGPTWSSFGANLGQLGSNLRPTWVQLKPTWAAFDFNLVPLQGQFENNLKPTWGQHVLVVSLLLPDVKQQINIGTVAGIAKQLDIYIYIYIYIYI